MTFELMLFYLFAAILLGGGVLMVTVRNPVYAALSLILCFSPVRRCGFCWKRSSLGIVLILVYVGAVMVLFLFVIMMLDINQAVLRAGFIRYLPAGAAGGTYHRGGNDSGVAQRRVS
ncbi:MAG: NADH-quinone oxidoreductase subunit J [Thiolinea sp.]